MDLAAKIFRSPRLARLGDETGADRHLAEAAWNIEHILRLAKAREMTAQGSDEPPALLDRQAEMPRPLREIGMMQIIGLDAHLDKAAHQRRERFDIVVDAAQQHALASAWECRRRSAWRRRARAASVNSRGWLACRTT